MDKHRALFSWLSLGLLVVLVCALGVLQYRWTGEVSRAEQKRLQENLQGSLNEVARDFNFELSRAFAALTPSDEEVTELSRERAYERRYAQWKDSASDAKLFSRVALAWEDAGRLTLRMMDPVSGTFAPADWPTSWSVTHERIAGRLRRRPRGEFMRPNDDSSVIEIPRFGRAGEQEWLLAEVDSGYVASAVLPSLFARHFGQDYQAEYETALFTDRGTPDRAADASAAVLDIGPMPGRSGPRPPPGPGVPRFGGPGRGRWRLTINLKAGSLDAVVARARWRNLGVSGGILLLLIATGSALLRFSRQAQRLANAEMEFVAGVSHELRTPLTVIRTAAFNLRGRLAQDPNQVERYGRLIQNESEKLTAIIEQVLRFSNAKNGRVIREREPVLVESLIADTLQSSRDVLEETLCRVDRQVEPGLPPILGDSVALRHAFQNLISNALKYGLEEDRWIGVFARTRGSEVEIRIEDHGPGIPEEEQKYVFDAFFRGKKAVRDQVHGTGLGLSLVKKIVEAHGGTVEVESEPGAGTSFIMRIPTWRAEDQDELAHSLG